MDIAIAPTMESETHALAIFSKLLDRLLLLNVCIWIISVRQFFGPIPINQTGEGAGFGIDHHVARVEIVVSISNVVLKIHCCIGGVFTSEIQLNFAIMCRVLVIPQK